MEKERYNTFSFRLNKNTYELLKKLKVVNGKSWNRFLYEIINDHVDNNEGLYREKVFKPIYRKERKNKCELCGAENNLSIHHKDGHLTNNNKKNLQTLCNKCHGKQYPRLTPQKN